jgi:hypothetical protein
VQVLGVNVSEKALGTDKSGRLTFFNQRSELWWRMREALDPANDTRRGAAARQGAPRRAVHAHVALSGLTIKVASREEIWEKIGRSVDRASPCSSR